MRLEYECDHTDGVDELTNEYNLKKFLLEWSPIYDTKQVLSDPILVEINHIKYDTGNKYITSAFLNGEDKEDTIYTYNREAAWIDIVKECFNELGMEFRKGLTFSATKNEKIWSNSEASGIKYVVAFGTYVMTNTLYYTNPTKRKGTLTDMIAEYEEDRNGIREIIITMYNKHFGNINTGNFNFNALLNNLELSLQCMEKVESKIKTKSHLFNAIQYLNKSIKQINSAYFKGD